MATALGMRRARWPRSMRAKSLAEKAIKRSQGPYFKRPNNSGLQKWLTMEEMVALGDRYLQRFGKEPLEATREFTYAVMDKVAAPAEGRRWVDGTPANARGPARGVSLCFPVLLVRAVGHGAEFAFGQPPPAQGG